MRTINLSEQELKNGVTEILRQLLFASFKPDYIVGLTRGGLIPATMISHYLKVPLHTLNVSLRDTTSEPETNCWMAEDAFGCVSEEMQKLLKSRWDISSRKKILIIDDINDTGATFNWIKQDWQSSCFPDQQDVWKTVWGNNVKFAVLINNESSDFDDVSFSYQTINKFEEPDLWVNFPWENWWKY